MLHLRIRCGDILDETADVLVSSANTNLAMTGGVNGAILARGGKGVQQELKEHLRGTGRDCAEPGTVVRTGPGPLAFRHILHAVAVDAFHESTPALLRRTIERALAEACALGAASVALPALATGYGNLGPADFAAALERALRIDWPGLEQLVVVLRHEPDAEKVRAVLHEGDQPVRRPAAPTDWRTRPMPAAAVKVPLDLPFPPEIYSRFRMGIIPEGMDDKWFIYLEDGHLRFHRSWTGSFIFDLELVREGAGARAVSVTVNHEDYRSSGTADDLEMLGQVIRWKFEEE